MLSESCVCLHLYVCVDLKIRVFVSVNVHIFNRLYFMNFYTAAQGQWVVYPAYHTDTRFQSTLVQRCVFSRDFCIYPEFLYYKFTNWNYTGCLPKIIFFSRSFKCFAFWYFEKCQYDLNDYAVWYFKTTLRLNDVTPGSVYC